MNTTKPMTLYVVTTREHDDGDVIAIFSSKEKAQETVAAWDAKEDAYLTARIEVYTLDLGPLQLVEKGYFNYALRNYNMTTGEVESLTIVPLTLNNCFDLDPHTAYINTETNTVSYFSLNAAPGLSLQEIKERAKSCKR